MDERLKKQLEFALEIDKEKNIIRRTHLTGRGRLENDAEHAWQMAIMAYILKEHSNVEIDISKVMLMCLIHDIVEIDAGDTDPYGDEVFSQKEREDRAKERIFSLLPEDQKNEMIAIFDEFEAYETPEAKFAHAIDNVQPNLLNDSNDGYDWEIEKVSEKKVYERQNRTKLGSEALFEYVDSVVRRLKEEGLLLP